MTIIDWRKNPERRSMSLEMLNQPTLREMIALVKANGPAEMDNIALRDGFDATITLGEIRGYRMALNNLLSLAEPLPASMENLRETWGADTQPELPK